MDNTLDQVADLLVDRLGITKTEITPKASFTRDLGLDSLDYAELIMAFEQQFDIRIPDTEAETLETVQKAVDYLNSKTLKNVN